MRLRRLVTVPLLPLAVAACGSTTSSATGGSATSTTSLAAPATSASPASAAAVPGSAAADNTPNPVGDIPDTTAYVTVDGPGGSFAVKVPEGWSSTTTGSGVRYTDKLNSVTLQAVPAPTAPTPATATAAELPGLRSQPGFSGGAVTTVKRTAGAVVEITYTADAPADPVTGKVVRDAVERYEFWHSGTEAVLTLAGPVGADNVDPWRTITDSLRWK